VILSIFRDNTDKVLKQNAELPIMK